MVKGISRQVIVVDSPEPRLFEQAIFILRDDAVNEGITDEALLREAKNAIRYEQSAVERRLGLLWAFAGATLMGIIWAITSLF